MTLEAGVAAVAARVDRGALVAVAGGSCSGKSTFARLLVAALGDRGLAALHVEVDRWLRDADDPAMPRDDRGRIVDGPALYHQDELIADVAALRRGGPVPLPRYDLARNRRAGVEVVTAPAGAILVVEGLYAITAIAPPRLAVYVDAGDALRRERRIARDGELGVPAEVVGRAFDERVLPGHRRDVAPQAALADVVVDNPWRPC